ncbi:MAG: tetratricopeptide repeat protein [Methanomicrobiales archaeon]|nr:tetratricopeptide repeat protein [Methanomicrobiales archaeon]MDI6875700.1 tetratricopeptide repeat protein [Methanomicrobiales archaeon]
MIKKTVQRLLGLRIAALNQEGMEHLREGRYKSAVECFDQVIAADPANPQAFFGKGRCLNKMGFFESAIAYFDRALELDPRYADAAFQKGISLVSLGRVEEGLASFDRVLTINPDSAEAWDNKAVCYQLLGDRVQAERCLEKGMQLRGESTDLKPLLGRWYSSR